MTEISRSALFGRLNQTALKAIEMGQTTPDDRFTLLPVACLGACDLAPAMMVDEDLHGRLTEARLDAILEQYP